MSNTSYHPVTAAPIPSANVSLTYAYVPNSPLVLNTVAREAAATRLTQVREFDNLNRLMSISAVNTGTPALGSGLGSITYDSDNRRDLITLADGSWWDFCDFGYDMRGQPRPLARGQDRLPIGSPNGEGVREPRGGGRINRSTPQQEQQEWPPGISQPTTKGNTPSSTAPVDT